MKRHGVVNASIASVLAHMGHTDTLTIADLGLPIPYAVERIDVSIQKGLPSFVDVLAAVAEDMHIEEIILADEIREFNPSIHQDIVSMFPTTKTTYLSHELFKQKTSESHAVIRTGEVTPYANIILVSNVNF
jgi:D-ribose pyranase